MKKALLFTFLVFSIGVGITPADTHAQNIQIVNANDVSLSTSPALPGPFEETTISLESFVVNLDTSGITWIVDGREIVTGVGQKSITVTTRDLGDPLLVEVRIRWNQIDTLIKRVRIQPAYVDLLWEAVNSYTPPFYRGKALPTSESFLRVVALPSGVITNDQYVYIWEHNGNVQQDQSGFRKNSFIIRNNFFDKRFQVGVNVTGRLAPFRAQASLVLPRYEPEIRFAVESLTGEPVAQENNSFVISGSFNRLVAHPYYFSAADMQGFDNLEFNWSINGERYIPDNIIELPDNEIVLTPPQDISGLSTVSISIANTNEILQQATAQTRIRF